MGEICFKRGTLSEMGKCHVLRSPQRHHHVQFYEVLDELMEPLSTFVEVGLARKESVVLIVTPECWKRLLRQLGKKADREKLIRFDAQTVIDRILVDGSPDPGRFEELVGKILKSTGGRPFRAFGEAVNLLTRDGNFEAALLLEGFWNGLLRRRSFRLFCAYDVRVFYKAMRGSEYRQLRSIHDHVLCG
jgi:hypothetical protein